MNQDVTLYSSSLGKLSQVQKVIIERLWCNNMQGFPKPWVDSKELLSLTQQKGFDRVIRVLKHEHGCHIEHKNFSSKHFYRMVSDQIMDCNKRIIIKKHHKAKVFEKSENTCEVCGVVSGPGLRGLQADHKVPVIRGGASGIENLQALCHNCNAIKRNACKGCADECKSCYWAFPERNRTKIKLHKLVDKLFKIVLKYT